jgi:hypothetical protein
MKIGLAIALGLALVIVAGAGCSHGSAMQGGDQGQGGGSENTGAVGLSIQLAPGVTLSTINYSVTLGGNTVAAGAVDVSQQTTTATFSVPLPVATGYQISITGTSTDGSFNCAGSATFDILAGATTSVAMTLACHGPKPDSGTASPPDGGVASIVVTTDVCPTLASASATPSKAQVGGSIALTASASDLNVSAALAYAWTQTGSGGGTFGTPMAANTTFICTSAGMVMVQAAVSDGTCGDQTTLSFECDPVAGQDAGPDAADASSEEAATTGSLVPCTTAGQTNCVKCQGNASGLCSPTEAQIVQHDIAKGLATAAGPDRAASCYACMVANSCVDDTMFTDTGHECEDPISGTTTAAECSATLSCILQSSCASAGSVAMCYCGTLSSATCKNNPAAVNGACDTQIATGLGFATTDGTDNANNLTNTTLASGRADQIILCAINNSCTSCLH